MSKCAIYVPLAVYSFAWSGHQPEVENYKPEFDYYFRKYSLFKRLTLAFFVMLNLFQHLFCITDPDL
jgi:hypothetical protein